MRASNIRWQFVFFPEILSGAGKHRLSPCIAPQIRSQIEDAIQIGMKGSILADRRSAFQCLLHHIFGNNRLPAMRTILRRIGLKIKTQGACPFRFIRMKNRQFTDFVPGHHLEAP